MRLQSDVDALAAIEEDAKAMLKRIGLTDDAAKLDVVVFPREVIDLASYTESAHQSSSRRTSSELAHCPPLRYLCSAQHEPDQGDFRGLRVDCERCFACVWRHVGSILGKVRCC